jgi:putative transposase
MKTSLVLDTLEMALWSRQRDGIALAAGMVHHNDAGSQGGFTRSSQHLDESRWRWAGLLAG